MRLILFVVSRVSEFGTLCAQIFKFISCLTCLVLALTDDRKLVYRLEVSFPPQRRQMPTNWFPIYSKMGQPIGNPRPESTLSPSLELRIWPLVCEYEYILTKMPSFVYPEVFRNLHRTRLSRRRMIWLLPHPPPSPVTVVRKHDWWVVTHRKIAKERQLYDEGGIGGEPKHTTTRSLVIYTPNNSTLFVPTISNLHQFTSSTSVSTESIECF